MERTNGRQGVTERLMNTLPTTALRNNDPFYHCHSAAAGVYGEDGVSAFGPLVKCGRIS
jgi:hypothetical protein